MPDFEKFFANLESQKQAQIRFNMDGEDIEFSIIHNLPDDLTQDMGNALETWVASTDQHDAFSFCAYLMSKSDDFIAFSEEDLMKMLRGEEP